MKAELMAAEDKQAEEEEGALAPEEEEDVLAPDAGEQSEVDWGEPAPEAKEEEGEPASGVKEEDGHVPENFHGVQVYLRPRSKRQAGSEGR